MTYYAPKESLPYGKKFSSKKFKVLRYNPGVTDGFNLGTSVPTNCCCRETHGVVKDPTLLRLRLYIFSICRK